MTNDEKIELIVNIGLKLPYYDYQYRAYIAETFKNERLAGSVRGVDIATAFESFSEACDFIIDLAIKNGFVN